MDNNNVSGLKGMGMAHNASPAGEKILEGNKIIAEFMGMKSERIDHEEGTDWWWNNCPKGLHYAFEDAPTFGSSWSWLMPVVEKIEGLKFSVNILRNTCSIYDESFKDQGEGKRIYTVDDSKIGATYKAIIQLITWYNQQTPSNEQ